MGWRGDERGGKGARQRVPAAGRAGPAVQLTPALPACTAAPQLHGPHMYTDLCCSPMLPLLQENQALQSKQRELQASLAQAEKAARTAAGQQERLAALQVRAHGRLGCCNACCDSAASVAGSFAGSELCWLPEQTAMAHSAHLPTTLPATPAPRPQAELRQALDAAAAAEEQLDLAESRTAVVERAYAAAVDVRQRTICPQGGGEAVATPGVRMHTRCSGAWLRRNGAWPRLPGRPPC